jgi:hypothetical protein
MATLWKRVSLRVLLSEEATTGTAETAADSNAEYESTHEEFSELDSLVTYEVCTVALAAVCSGNQGLVLLGGTRITGTPTGLPCMLALLEKVYMWSIHLICRLQSCSWGLSSSLYAGR